MNPDNLTPVGLANQALYEGRERHWEHAGHLVKEIVSQGTDAIRAALWIWTDELVGKVTGYADVDVHDVKYWSERTGDTDTVDDMPAQVRWAGRLITARLAKDEAMYDAVFESLPAETERRELLVAAALQCVVVTMDGIEDAVQYVERMTAQDNDPEPDDPRNDTPLN